MRWNDSHGLENLGRAGAQPGRTGQNGVSHGVGNLSPGSRQHFGDKERVPARRPVQFVSVDPVRRREPRDRRQRQRSDFDSRRQLADGDLAEQNSERVPAI